jgi:hypothetical protein
VWRCCANLVHAGQLQAESLRLEWAGFTLRGLGSHLLTSIHETVPTG